MATAQNADGTYTDPFAGLLTSAPGFMQALTSLLGGKTQASSNANTLESSATSSTGTNNSTTQSPLALQQLQQLFPLLQQQLQSQDFSKQAAINDSQGGVQLILKNLREQGLPGIMSGEAAQGAYNSTTKQLLGNDLTARAVGQGQALVTDTVGKYASAQAAQTGNLINAIRTAADASKTTTGTTTDNKIFQGERNVATVGDTKNPGLASNPLAQLLGGGIEAYSLFQALGPNAFSSLANYFGLGGTTVNPDGSVNWGSTGQGSGDEGGFPGDTSGNDFTSPDVPIDVFFDP